MTAVKLLPTFDAKAIQTDCQIALAASKGRPAGFAGEAHVGWQALTLYAQDVVEPLIDKTPYIRAMLDKLGIAARLVRIMVLEPGGVIREHSDAFLSARIVRLHVPVITHQDVAFYLDGQRCYWAPGELWYGDFSRPHHGVNRSGVTRVHLVIDALVDERLTALFPDALPASVTASNETDDLLDDAALRRLSFDFFLPRGFALPGSDPLPDDQPVPGALRVIDSELRLFVNEQPMLKAIPRSPALVELQGLGMPAQLVYDFSRGGALRVALEVGGAKILELDAAR